VLVSESEERLASIVRTTCVLSTLVSLCPVAKVSFSTSVTTVDCLTHNSEQFSSVLSETASSVQ